MIGADLLPARRKFNVLEKIIALHNIAELDTSSFKSSSISLGRKSVAVDETSLSLCLLSKDCVGRVTGLVRCHHGFSQVDERRIRGRINWHASPIVSHFALPDVSSSDERLGDNVIGHPSW